MIKIWGTSFSLIGDLIMSLPQLNYFKKKYKDTYINFVIHKKIAYCAPLFFNHPYIDKIIISGEWSSFSSNDYNIASNCDVVTTKLDHKNKKILDVGFGYGNNTLFFCSLNLKVSGVEINKKICKIAENNIKRYGFSPNLKVGKNQKLPFKDNEFDYLVSWNVLHYEGNQTGIEKSIKEYSRVLKKNGRLIISTTGPQHKILKNSKTLGNHQYLLNPPNDFRKGQTHFFFDFKNYINLFFSKHFNKIQIGRIQDHLFTDTLDWWLISGIKK